ncbi:DUF5126 domain-containing protein [Maribellus sp. CM-23]|uniref:DUF5126 domain-containing protein n=1 Tax=Maribellus sp. CM-23 TaxID=2781026 RepID=UPI001F1E94E0|nr:DUF5126 domain-containing protein [Maribellus sp. CM-23]MCE4566162.1 DUF5126 domain-containing protein [Maribellus sp. CM-23]
MKKIINIFYLLSIFLFAASCSDDDENVRIPGQVVDLSAEADYGAVVLKWGLPSGEGIDYVNISYSIEGQDFSKNISKFNLDSVSGYVTATIDGFADTNEYQFKLASCNIQGGKSEPVTISKAPLPPAYNEVISTISVVPDFGGGIISWVNETGKTLVISVSYPDPENPTARETVKFTSSDSGKDFITNLPADPITFEVTVSDQYKNSSEPVSFDITPLAESVISKDTWTVPGYVDNSNFETIGYSSQEAGGEGGSPQGRVIALLDDELGTFWHASWASFGATYPHWFIIDLGKEVTVSRVALTRRQGNGQGQVGQQFLTCAADGASDQNDPTTWNWEDQGVYSFDINTNSEQSYRLTNNPKTRYLKVYFGTDKKGKSNYAMLSNLRIFGQE